MCVQCGCEVPEASDPREPGERDPEEVAEDNAAAAYRRGKSIR